ncbi:winged helix-turn-helix domain-containing protein, partial [Patescibacteria group bacterium]|nr:winged helix-turn-helix domain-containing protein [Patescibacteria group bacterium]
MLEQLFGSKTRVAILALFFANEAKSFYVQEIIKLSKTDASNAHRELGKLEKLGILFSHKKANQRYYSLNKELVHYKGLKELFGQYDAGQSEDKWFMLEEIPPKVNPNGLISYMHIPNANAYLKTQGFKNGVKGSLMEFNKQSANLYFLKGDFQKLGEEIFNKLIDDPQWGLKYIRETIAAVKHYFSVSTKVYKTNLKNLTDKELHELYIEHFGAELKMR